MSSKRSSSRAIVNDAKLARLFPRVPVNDDEAQSMVDALMPANELEKEFRAHLQCPKCICRRRIRSIIAELHDKTNSAIQYLDHPSANVQEVYDCVRQDYEQIIRELSKQLHAPVDRNIRCDRHYLWSLTRARITLRTHNDPSSTPELYTDLHDTLSRVIADVTQAQVPEIVDTIASYMDLRSFASCKELFDTFTRTVLTFIYDQSRILDRLDWDSGAKSEAELDQMRCWVAINMRAMSAEAFKTSLTFFMLAGMAPARVQLALMPLKKCLESRGVVCGHTTANMEVIRQLLAEQTERAGEEAARLQDLGFFVRAAPPRSTSSVRFTAAAAADDDDDSFLLNLLP